MKESETDFLYQSLPIDPENQILLANEHPSNWVNPCPKKIYDLIVIGAGPAGLVSAITARDQGKSVALIERDLIGGECMNIGCIPSKAILRTSRLYADMLNAENFGAEVPNDISINFDIKKVSIFFSAKLDSIVHAVSGLIIAVCDLRNRLLLPDQNLKFQRYPA
jgi:thioredoxin reductase